MNPIPQIARKRLAASQLTAHPEADLLNAFAEQTLRPAERQTILAHLSLCADCRSILALAQPELIEKQAVFSPTPRRGWFRLPALRFGLALACVAIVGTAVSLHYLPSSPKPSAPIPAQVATATPGPMAAAQPAPTNSLASTPSSPLDQTTTARAAKKAPANTMAFVMIPGRAKQDSEAMPMANLDNNLPAAAPATPFSAAAKSAPAARTNLSDVTGTPRWALSSDGSVQRSVDSGATWQSIRVADGQSFLAIAALGQNVWLGGTNGTLYHSADAGNHWAQVKPSADGETLSEDILGVEFSDPQHGKVTTSSNAWTTDDGGTSWQKLSF